MRYLPAQLTARDKQKQVRMLLQSKRLYKKHRYYTRKRLPSYKNKTSKHIQNAQKIYKIQQIGPNNELAKKTGCSLSALNQIVRKGEGAYFSSGSRPNRTILGLSQVGKFNNRWEGCRGRLQYIGQRMRSQKEGVYSGQQVEKDVQVWSFENKKGFCCRSLIMKNNQCLISL